MKDFIAQETSVCSTNKSYFKLFFYLILISATLYLGYKNFQLYHIIVENLSTIIGLVMLVLCVNTYKLIDNKRMIFLGIAFGFVAILDLLHLFSYREITVFKNFTFNTSIELWDVGRYMQSISILAYFLLKNKKVDLMKISYLYIAILVASVISILFLNVFPDSYIESIGFTNFNLVSRYINLMILLISLILLSKQNKVNPKREDKSLGLAILFIIIYEILFIFSHSSEDSYSIFAHIFQLLSYICIYNDIVKYSLQEPYFSLKNLNNVLSDKNKDLEILLKKLEIECEEKQSKKRLLNAILDSVVDGVLVVSENDEVIHINKQFIDTLDIPFKKGYTTNKDIINYVSSRVTNKEEFLSDVKREWEQNGKYIKYIYMINNKKIEIFSIPFSYNNTIKGRLITCRDITEKFKIQELEKQVQIRQASIEKMKEFDELRTNFFCTVSHELKTPINIILGVIQLVSTISKNEEDKIKLLSSSKYINIMKQNCFRLIKLSNNLIDITKIDSGYTEMNLKNHNIVSVIEEITLSVADYVKSKNISLVFDTEIEEKIIACDSEQLERVMLNLLSNAIKFTSENGKIEVTILDKNDYISISVKDTGIGIPKDKADIVFERFRQVDSTLRREKEGSGIGLALVKTIIEKHGGTIKLESELGKGSEFIINMPCRKLVQENLLPVLDENKEINVDRINIEFSDIYELNVY